MQAADIEVLWRRGDRRGAITAARAAADREDRLEVAEALLRCAVPRDDPEWEEAARLAVELRSRSWPPDHPRAAYAAMPLAGLLQRAGHFDESEAVLRECERLATAAGSADPDALRLVVFDLAKLQLARGRDDEAEAAFLRAAEIAKASQHPRRPPFTAPLLELRALYMRQGRYAEAAEMAKRRLAVPSRQSPRDRAILLAELAESQLAAGRAAEARQVLASARRLVARSDPSDPLTAMLKRLADEASRSLPR